MGRPRSPWPDSGASDLEQDDDRQGFGADWSWGHRSRLASLSFDDLVRHIEIDVHVTQAHTGTSGCCIDLPHMDFPNGMFHPTSGRISSRATIKSEFDPTLVSPIRPTTERLVKAHR